MRATCLYAAVPAARAKAPGAVWRTKSGCWRAAQAHARGVGAPAVTTLRSAWTALTHSMCQTPLLAQRRTAGRQGTQRTQHGTECVHTGLSHTRLRCTGTARPHKPARLFSAGPFAWAGAPERAGTARGGPACSAVARAGFQPYQGALCLDSNGAPVDRFCPQPGAAMDAVAASGGARGDSDVANNTAQVRTRRLSVETSLTACGRECHQSPAFGTILKAGLWCSLPCVCRLPQAHLLHHSCLLLHCEGSWGRCGKTASLS